jgi:hypothetical protein
MRGDILKKKKIKDNPNFVSKEGQVGNAVWSSFALPNYAQRLR